MTDPRAWLDQVDARTNAATNGPWERDRTYLLGHPGPYSISVRSPQVTVSDGLTKRDAEFIAGARTDLPAATTALRAVLDRLDKYGKHIPAVDDMDASEAPAEYWQGARDAVEHTVADLRIAITTALSKEDA